MENQNLDLPVAFIARGEISSLTKCNGNSTNYNLVFTDFDRGNVSIVVGKELAEKIGTLNFDEPRSMTVYNGTCIDKKTPRLVVTMLSFGKIFGRSKMAEFALGSGL
jgi:hypothetical protein